MKTRFVIFLLLFLAVSQVHALSMEVKADLLATKIAAVLNAKDDAQAVALFEEYDALGVAMPPALLLQRAKVYFRQKAYYKTQLTLEKYLEEAERGSTEYNKALVMYADVEGKAAAAPEAKAARAAAIKVRGGNLCSDENDKYCYAELDNQRGCYIVVNSYTKSDNKSEKYEWQGACDRGFAHGDGTFRRERKDRWWEDTGSVDVHGLKQGHWKGVDYNRYRWEGSYVNGKRHGTHMTYKDGNTVFEEPYVNGEPHGTHTWYDDDRGTADHRCYRNGKHVRKGRC